MIDRTIIKQPPMVIDAGTDFSKFYWRTYQREECDLAINGTTYKSDGGDVHLVTARHLVPATKHPYSISCRGKRVFDMPAPDGAKTAPATDDYSFVVMGDTGTLNTAQSAFAGLIEARDPDFLLHVGDVNYDDGREETYPSRFFERYYPTICRVPTIVTPGAHDKDTLGIKDGKKLWGEPFYRIFGPSYPGWPDDKVEQGFIKTFKYRNCEVFLTDVWPQTQDIDTGDVDVDLLDQLMAASTAEWKFAIVFKPVFAVCGTTGDIPLRNKICPVFDARGLDVCFHGQIHAYERSLPVDASGTVQGTDTSPGAPVYVTACPTGQTTVSCGAPDVWTATATPTQNYVLVTVAGSSITLEAFNSSDVSIDSISWSK